MGAHSAPPARILREESAKTAPAAEPAAPGVRPSQALVARDSAAEPPAPLWAHVVWSVWYQFELRQVALRNPTGPGTMPS